MKRSPIKRTTPLKRGGRVNPVSAKRKALYGKRTDTRNAVMERDGNRCQAGLEGCTKVATDVHEIKTRARGGSITDETNCLALCRPCHRYITDHPAFAKEAGYVISAWEGAEGLQKAAQRRLGGTGGRL